MGAAETQIRTAILREFGTRNDMRVWNNPAGVAKPLGTERVMKFGVLGQADISGIYRGGLRIEIEVKTVDGRQSEVQKNFEGMIRVYGGIYILARSVDDVYDGFARSGFHIGRTPVGGMS